MDRSLRLFEILAIRALSEVNNIEMESKLKIEYYSTRTNLGRCVPTKNIVQILKRNECCRSISIIKVFRRPKIQSPKSITSICCSRFAKFLFNFSINPSFSRLFFKAISFASCRKKCYRITNAFQEDKNPPTIMQRANKK